MNAGSRRFRRRQSVLGADRRFRAEAGTGPVRMSVMLIIIIGILLITLGSREEES